MMKKITAIGIVILFLAGLVPLLWLKPDFIISNGDNIPPSLNADKTFGSSASMWSPDYLGYASPNPAYLLNTYFAAFLGDLGISVGYVQILFQILLYMGAGFAMYFFSKTMYPDNKIAPFFAALFYLFNFFILDTRFNLGFAWLYTFLPFLLALFVRILNATYRQDKKSANLGIIYFSLVSVVALSVTSINPANIALFLFALSVFAVYFLIKHRKNLLPFLFAVGKITVVTIPINTWWVYPMLNTFIFSPTGLNSQINVASWDWTHARASFLNLFWLNGIWGWLPEYVQQWIIDYYNYPIIAILMFVPFITAVVALLFKSNKSRFNAYIMGCILIFIFLATGLHDPIARIVNSQLYQHIPLMSMFREPASKFTLLAIPFLALLIGYAADKIANIKLNVIPKKLKLAKIFVLLFLAFSFIVSSLPIFTPSFFGGFVGESSYVKIPQYWFQASDWINDQPGDWKILLTPLNDFYQMNYSWGYYGSDQLLERFFEKPILSTAALNGYITNDNTSKNLMQIRTAVKSNNANEFKALLDLLSIKYIIQRNDIVTNVYDANHVLFSLQAGNNLKTPVEMQLFFAEQSNYLKLVKSFGQIDIYEYIQDKSSINALSTSTLEQIDIHIYERTIINNTIENWDWIALSRSQVTCQISQNNGSLKADMWTSPNASIRINSPLIQVEIESRYIIKAEISANNVDRVEIKIAEYSHDRTLLENWSLAEIDSGKFTSYDLISEFEPRTENTKYLNIQIWNIFGNVTTHSVLTVDNLSVTGTNFTLNLTGIEKLYANNPDKPTLSRIQNLSPTKIVVTVNATQPFILVTGQVLDRFWFANMNGQKISPTPVYLGLKGFIVNQTGQFEVTIEYEPQIEFNYLLALSGATLLILVIALVYLNRKLVKRFIEKKQMKV
jgi:hypothetical protein